jgi:hypothetical protein
MLRAARSSLTAAKTKPTTSIIIVNGDRVCPISLRGACSVAGNASVKGHQCIVVFCSCVCAYGPVGSGAIVVARKGNCYGNNQKQNRNETHFGKEIVVLLY